MKTFYLTTAIDYANGSPHLGHAYEKVLADVIVRTRRAMGEETYFVTGLDEHGQKVQQGAEKEKVTPLDRCNRIAGEFQDMLSSLNISHDDYIRTTENRHKKVVRTLLRICLIGERFTKLNTLVSIPRGQNNFCKKKTRKMVCGRKFTERFLK
jgi:methionyl-tRNA synthetase